MKRFLAIILSVTLLCTFVPAASAVASVDAERAAQSLYDLGLFQGTGNNADGTPNFDLDRTPTRAEAVTMLVRLLGKDAEAKAGAWETPFTDVADWARPYVGYAYANGLTTGTSDTTFGSEDPINATQYLTFVLRTLGYTSGTDFQWDSAWTKSNEINLGNHRYNADTTSFTRGDVAYISETALYTKGKGEDKTLGEKMGKFELLELTPENLKGVWKKSYIDWNDRSVDDELIFDSNTCKEIEKAQNGHTYYYEGEFTIADGNTKWLWQDVYCCDIMENGSKSYSLIKREEFKDLHVVGYSGDDVIVHFSDGTYVLRNTGWVGSSYIKVEKSELLDEGLKVMAAYKAENPTLEIILANTDSDDPEYNDVAMTRIQEDYRGEVSMWKMSNFHYDSAEHYDKTYTVTIYISGEWLKDRLGGDATGTKSCDIDWQLYDESQEYVIDSGTIYSPKVYAGGKFKDASDIIFNLPAATYYLVLSLT